MFCRDSGVLCAIIGDLAFGENELVQQHAFRGNKGNASDFVPFALGFHHFTIETEQVSANQSNHKEKNDSSSVGDVLTILKPCFCNASACSVCYSNDL